MHPIAGVPMVRLCVAILTLLLLAFTTVAADAASCTRPSVDRIIRDGGTATAAYDKCVAFARAVSSNQASVKQACTVCKIAQRKLRSVNLAFKKFAEACSPLVNPATATQLTEVTDKLYASVAPLSRLLKAGCR